jgi:tetratricopeptide (TPR) repeat protein
MKIRHIFLSVLIGTAAFADDAFQQGIDAYHDSEYTTATTAFQTAVKESESATAHHNLALALYQEGKVGESVWHLERALLLTPRNEQYHYKLGALRQQLGLTIGTPKWHMTASRALSQQGWIILLSIAFWITLAALILPKISGHRVSLPTKAVRVSGLIVIAMSASALYLNRDLTTMGIVLSNAPATLHAAPANAAPDVGLARPGERGQITDRYGVYIKIETEGGALGWISQESFREIL